MEPEEIEGGSKSVQEELFNVLPEGCIANVLSLTTPRDACRSSLVSSSFRSASESDIVWERFLPIETEYMEAIVSLSFSSKKQLFLHLCDHPLLIDDGKLSFSLDKTSGKKCYMLSPKELMIVWIETPEYWRWTSVPEARFPEVAELISVCWLEIRGRFNTRMLSPATLYTAYFVFKTTTGSYGFENRPIEVAVGLVGAEIHYQTVYLNAERRQNLRYRIVPRRRFGLFRHSGIMGYPAPQPRETDDGSEYPKERADGWLEIELGEFFNGGEDGELEMSILEVKGGDWKGGLIVQGIEIRPKP
ncbi:F-box protein At2g02240-like [Fagus crenata]